MQRKALQYLCLLLFGIYTAIALYDVISTPLGWPRPHWLLMGFTFSFFGFALLHAGLYLGWRNALAFWGTSFAVSLAFEAVGVLTGLIYGPYHYTDKLGWKFFGLVPALIPLAWFMMMYAAHTVVNAIAGTLPGDDNRPLRTAGAAVWLSLVAAAAMTAWDLSMDPDMVRHGYWVWHNPGPYFDIPVQNYMGWLATTFVVYLVYRLLERRWPPRITPPHPFALLPLAAYAVTCVNQVGRQYQTAPALSLISAFAMGSFVLAAATALRWRRVR